MPDSINSTATPGTWCAGHIVIEGVEFEPYNYREKFEDEHLLIHARIEGHEEARQKLSEAQKQDQVYLTVIRKGINDEPRLMRFGKTLWSERDGVKKVQFILVDKAFDDGNKPLRLLEPEFSNVQDILAETSALLHELFDTLVAKGILTEEERGAIKEKVAEKAGATWKEYSRVTDLDEWLNKEE